MIALLLAFLGSGWSWLGFALPLGLNSIEGSEAALLVGASAARGGWRKATIAALAAGVTLLPLIVGLYFLFRYVSGEYVDYAIAAVIFTLGLNEIREGLGERGEEPEDEPADTGGDTEGEGEGAEGGLQAKLGSYSAVWPAYVGGVLEASEAVLYTFGVSNGSASWVAASIGGGIGFLLPWAGLPFLRSWVESKPEWLVEMSIGVVLMAAATTFGTLRATGVFGA